MSQKIDKGNHLRIANYLFPYLIILPDDRNVVVAETNRISIFRVCNVKRMSRSYERTFGMSHTRDTAGKVLNNFGREAHLAAFPEIRARVYGPSAQ